MSQVIDILKSLGVDGTVFVQFAIFFVAYIAMSQIVILPYLAKHKERLRRTVGDQEEAVELEATAAAKEEEFKLEAKKLNTEIREIFMEKHLKAQEESNAILAKAYKDSAVEMEAAHAELAQSVEHARRELDGYIPKISENIENKMVRH